ncbi:cell division protein FtsN [Erwinia amylovora]|uniref:Cell division protein FtsN n=4 Tax=Erwinia amylovora TaxID=552 RepID=A0A831A093_ERWAM|nr:cell division protein FtsN [Erwinia amylovora]CBX78947.1 essential cell division protein FtsN [Erwinia amylovora ATCC BAA-2158]CDK13755.1 Cell division protein FtsN [Erwinia amylovora LA635]CDK17122.1 Cell division protein FtsN [Erwinia amylovora LA636]CDK20491.1 Cell division protein FtsN [Erwinia amylovora LA637]ATZ10099.1 cell division protein FtsN [Erwinia amylovora]
MAQKDYVSRGRATGTRGKKASSRSKKRSSGSGVSKIMIVLAVAVLITFVGGLWFIAHHKKEQAPTMADHKAAGNGLPPKPEERWRYIKELENRQIGVPTPTEPTSGGEAHSQAQLTDEQRQLLDQMQADMRQQPTQLNEVPWNEQTPVQRQQTLQRQQQNQLQQQSRMPAQLIPSSRTPIPSPHSVTITPATREPVRQAKPEAALQPKAENKPKEAEKQAAQRWVVQCGSFKGTEQAESIRAQLAFEGFESRIATGGGWNRVVIGPYNGRNTADNTLKRLHGSGHSNCIPVAAGG